MGETSKSTKVFEHFSKDATWEGCERLTEQMGWRITTNPGFSHERVATWAQYPYRYMLTELGQERGRIFKNIQTKMFNLQRLSAQQADTGLQIYSQYFLVGGSLYKAIHREVDMQQETAALSLANHQFILEHDLGAPNNEDIFEVESILKNAHLDGVDLYYRRSESRPTNE